ncbi:MAG: Fe-S cluster assembly transcriptional regulator IscR [Candidatus Thiodiazotropha sp. (ex Dulcina madagascariensis)]|nr:Fe-S cluster assembly transcriptional regulator IscR [Candidatus Thiodiazotropha sp. (ex Epidulcina cf. delphinae)]MCU7923567.1 Fe-S cluster assembly transcriptional regulator IscR [Candidatus Thiodiazotropha sp. (ex Dulcina madagascariensis)]MCU7927142.1 Fe-S cluster assembly transcriptional regulator IscR [Candidatus Thiodiazotropha sp. (ex Dulcina madagascariensis)]MCU7936582.1 Fe-S cluster assembly transcriptional regulator IscR [Candidatus Thiodiazotropha sp. (ex Dulcina madagascariensis
MKLTTKGRYAVTAMLDLSLHYGEGPITLADIAQRQGISLSYLEQLFSRLRKKSLVASVRGPGGGYSLGRDADEIYVGEVISAVDENIDTTRCNGAYNCHNNERCLTHELWSDLSSQIYNYLNKISLQDLMDRKTVREVAARQDHSNQEEVSGLEVTLADEPSDLAGA